MILGKSNSYKRLFKYKTNKKFHDIAEVPVCIWSKGKCIAKDESDRGIPREIFAKQEVCA